MKDEASVELMTRGRTSGEVAQRLLQSGFNVNSLRTNDTLLYDEWKDIDKKVLLAYQERLVGVQDLTSRGLTYSLNGLAKTVLAYQDASDLEDADLSMDGEVEGQRDRPEYDINYLPLPIIHKDFSYSVRELNESRNGNMPLDTTSAEVAARKVAEKAESMLFTGASTYTFGGGTIYGYVDTPHRNQVTLSVNWDASAITGALILADVIAMKQASLDDRRYGNWVLYVPSAYDTALDNEFKAASDKTIRQRILEIQGIEAVKISDKLTANNVILVQMTSDVVRIVEGLPITTVQWSSGSGMKVYFKVMAIIVPQIRADQTDKSGIIHLA